MEKEITPPVDIELILRDLTPDKRLRQTTHANNEIYVVDAFNAPNVMREVGRLREETFRAAGGGTGKEVDIDFFDTMDPPCRQLIVWDPREKKILGGYRYILGRDIVVENNVPRIATSHLFNFSEEFIRDYLPYTIELGRSFVRNEYQSSKMGAKALFALDNLWDGLGALTVDHPEIKYLFGKVTMYPTYHPASRNMILYFLNKYFADHDGLVTPIRPLDTHTNMEDMESLFNGSSFQEDYRILNRCVRENGFTIPPLVNAYMNLSPTMRMFGTAINDEFGDVEESGILITIDEIFEEKKQRYISSYAASLQAK